MTVMNFLFLFMGCVVFGCFVYNILQTWKSFALVGSGKEEVRDDVAWVRLRQLIKDGLLQPKMVKDPPAAVMHFLIFWGFITVSLGTIETCVHGLSSHFFVSQMLGYGIGHRFLL